MKWFLISAAVLFISSTVNVNAQDKNVMPVTPSNLPYKIGYTNVTLGNPAYAQKLMSIYKYYEENNIEKVAENFDENIIGYMPDGNVIKGKAATVKLFREMRESIVSFTLDIQACVVLKSPDMPDREAVSVWFVESDTAKDGTVNKYFSNEVWFFNKQGKVVEAHAMVGKYGE